MKIQRSPRTPYIRGVRPMVRTDLEALREKSSRPVIQKLSAAHNTMVRLFALGYTVAEVARELGYSQSRVHLIRNSPAFQEKLARFTDAADTAVLETVDMTARMQATVRVNALGQIAERVESGEESTTTLLKIYDSMADRSGYHRKTATQNTNVNFAIQLEAAWAKSKSVRQIDAE